MRIVVLTIVLSIVPLAAFAQVGGPLDTSAGGSVSGAYSGSVDTSAGGAVRQPREPGIHRDEAPLDVRRYIQAHPGAPPTSGGPLGVGATLPNDAAVRTVPGYPQWGYSSQGGQDAVINRDTGVVTDTVGK
jgi:hypothetical protein